MKHLAIITPTDTQLRHVTAANTAALHQWKQWKQRGMVRWKDAGVPGTARKDRVYHDETPFKAVKITVQDETFYFIPTVNKYLKEQNT